MKNKDNKNQIEIRQTRKEDLPEIFNLWKESWIEIYPNEGLGITKDMIKNLKILNAENLLNWQEKFIDDSLYSVLLADEEIIGFIYCKKNVNTASIKSIYLKHDFIGKGYGKLLMERALEQLKDCNEITVECAKYNDRAIKFYEKFGFKDPIEIDGIKINDETWLPIVKLTKTIQS